MHGSSDQQSSDVSLLFLGSGTSAGIPMIGCRCEVCTSDNPRDKRTRSSVVFQYDGLNVLVDTTPELRMQCVAGGIELVESVVYTHAHADHIMGLDDVRRFNALRGGPLDVWADQATHAALGRCFEYAFNKPDPASVLFRPHLEKRYIEGPFEIAGRTWTPIPLLHGQMPVLGFRVGNIAYCTDVSEIPPASYDLLQDLDVLVLDALQHKKHSTHFNLAEAIDEAKKIGAKETWFTHIAHGLGHEKTNAELPAGMRLAHDGLKVGWALPTIPRD